MKTISFFSILLGLLMLTSVRIQAETTVDPQLFTLDKKKSAIFQLPQGEESKVLVKIKNDMEGTLMEMEVDANVYKRKLFNFSNLRDGIYYMDIFHDGEITRKTLEIRWDGVEVVGIRKMSREPFYDAFFNLWS
ncbi:MAG: hypothetical protein AAGE93_13280 [Bacteroidota bacterium]